MRAMSEYLRRSLPPFVAGACAAAAGVAIDNGNFPLATVLLLAAVLLIAPRLPVGVAGRGEPRHSGQVKSVAG